MNRTLLSAALVVMLVLSSSASVLAQPWVAQKEVDVRINVPAMQVFEETQAVSVVVPGNAEETVTFYGVGLTRMRSNVAWGLDVGVTGASGYDVMVRPSGTSTWESVNGWGAQFVGDRGAHDLTWDIQLVPVNPPNHDHTLFLNFTLRQQ